MSVVTGGAGPGAAAQLLRKTAPVSFRGCACRIRSNVRVLSGHAKTPGDRMQRITQRPRVVTVPHKIIFSLLRSRQIQTHTLPLPE
jgi:hypothetical protein